MPLLFIYLITLYGKTSKSQQFLILFWKNIKNYLLSLINVLFTPVIHQSFSDLHSVRWKLERKYMCSVVKIWPQSSLGFPQASTNSKNLCSLENWVTVLISSISSVFTMVLHLPNNISFRISFVFFPYGVSSRFYITFLIHTFN